MSSFLVNISFVSQTEGLLAELKESAQMKCGVEDEVGYLPLVLSLLLLWFVIVS